MLAEGSTNLLSKNSKLKPDWKNWSDYLYRRMNEIDTIVNEDMQFLSGLEFTLHNSLPQEKLTTIRQCIEKIGINKPTGEITLVIRKIPAGNLLDTQEKKTFV